LIVEFLLMIVECFNCWYFVVEFYCYCWYCWFLFDDCYLL